MSAANKILFATSEAAPLIKTGGLGDVSGSLPVALKALRKDVRMVLPAYREVVAKVKPLNVVGVLDLGLPHSVRILEGQFPNSKIPLLLIDAPSHFDRAGNPYVDAAGKDWADNAERFAVYSKVIERIALDDVGLNWRPNVVHCNDWQTGLAAALLARHHERPTTAFTVHNLAYQGNFPASTFRALQALLKLPSELFRYDAMEFHGQFSFIKGGLAFADRINTVSPTYAKEIRTPEFGCGLDGLLNFRAGDLEGILNGADYAIWNPAQDTMIAQTYDAEHLEQKYVNKHALQQQMGLPIERDTPLIGMVGRLVEQKGVSLVLQALPDLASRFEFQLVVLGSGDLALEQAFRRMAALHPTRIAVRTGFSEPMAHLIEAGSDMFLMPSLFEPCGLNQMYSLRYGTVPIVRHTGGLADTVRDTTAGSLRDGTANGISFVECTEKALADAIGRALGLYEQKAVWRALMARAMADNYSWERSARSYLQLYAKAAKNRAKKG